MKLPLAARSLDALRTMLGMADEGGVGARLEKWTSRGALGWAIFVLIALLVTAPALRFLGSVTAIVIGFGLIRQAFRLE